MRSVVSSLVVAAVVVSACTSAPQPTPASAPVRQSATATTSATVAAIMPNDLEKRLFIIADDSMMGRETGSEGDFKTTAYVASEFRRLGLQPAGDSGTYFQVVPFWTVAPDSRSHITVGAATLALRRDFALISVPITTRTIATEAIFGGALNDTTRWISAEQAQHHIVVLDATNDLSARGVALRHFAGAAAIAFVALEQMAPEALARFLDGRPVRDSSLNATAMPTLYLSRRAATVLLGANPASLELGAMGPKVDAMIGFRATPVKFPARNVVAILPGSDPALRGEYVALTAHHDHVGFDRAPIDHDSVRAFDRIVRPMGADSRQREATAAEWVRIRSILDSLRRVNKPRPDSIRNGADDDGSGTVSILEIAEAMALGPVRPRRSILFVNHVAEEAGLLGSAWFTDHATVPVDSIVVDIDQDMVGRGRPDDFPRPSGPPASPTYLEVVGDQKISREFASMLEAANAKQPVPFEFDRSYAAPGHPLQYYCRADHYNYARYGIPAVALSRGEHLDYHQVTDEPQYISYPDLARVSKMVFDAAMLIANADHRPALDVPKPADPHAPCRQ
jgi:Peptidase family M28